MTRLTPLRTPELATERENARRMYDRHAFDEEAPQGGPLLRMVGSLQNEIVTQQKDGYDCCPGFAGELSGVMVVEDNARQRARRVYA